MTAYSTEISVKGKVLQVPAIDIEHRTVITSGKWLKVASIFDEDWLEGEIVRDPEAFLTAVTKPPFEADIFTFADKFHQGKEFDYPLAWDNIAVIPITNFTEWWERRLSQDSRRNVRLSVKRGVTVKPVEFNDEFVRGIVNIYNETPVRAGRPFWHFGKAFDAAKRENSTYAERSQFLGAFYENELIGFLKMVYVGKVASIMQILTKVEHMDKRTSNALIAKAVEICAGKGMSYLEYCKYNYGNEENSQLTEFKRRNGFERLLFPRYYIPLTFRGRVSIKLGLHLSIREILPAHLLRILLHARSKYNAFRHSRDIRRLVHS